MLVDYLVVGQVLPHNPADAVRGPRLVVRAGETPVLQEEEPGSLLAAIDGLNLVDLRDRTLLSVLLYSFSRIGATVALRVRDYEHQRRRAYLALHEKGGQHRRVPVHSRVAEAHDAYLEASGLGQDLGCHSCRATGITNYLLHSGTLSGPRRSPVTPRPGRHSSTTVGTNWWNRMRLRE
jgi:integrase/recombinase XerD